MNLKNETVTGKVATSRAFAGSFRHITLEGDSRTFTVGIGPNLGWPRVGDCITLQGCNRAGTFDTQDYEVHNDESNRGARRRGATPTKRPPANNIPPDPSG